MNIYQALGCEALNRVLRGLQCMGTLWSVLRRTRSHWGVDMEAWETEKQRFRAVLDQQSLSEADLKP